MRFAPFPLAFFVALALAKFAAVAAQLGSIRLRFLLATLGVLLVAVAFAGRGGERSQRRRLLVVDLALTLLALVDVVHNRAFGDVPSVASLRSAWQLGMVLDATLDLFLPQDLVLLLTLPVHFLPRGWNPISRRAAGIAAVAGVLLVTSTFAGSRRHRSAHGNVQTAIDVGLASYHAFDLFNYAKRLATRMQGREEAAERVRAWFDARGPAPISPLHGVAAGRNVLVIQFESLQGIAAGAIIGGQPITPHLDALAKESLHFTRFFEQATVGRTSDAQFVSNCSLFATNDAPVVFEYASNEFRCLPTLLRERGYHTALFQPLAPRLWNSAVFDPKLGFAEVRSARDLVIDEVFGMGLSDASFYRQLVPRLQELPQPWYTFALSISSHKPFDDTRMPRSLDLGELEGTRMGHYLHSVHYADQALGSLVAMLRETGLLDRTVLVVYGDHDGVTRETANLADFVDRGDDEFAWFLDEQRVPLLVRLPEGEHAGEYPTLGAQLDLAPTLAGLLGVPLDDALFLGRDLLAPMDEERSVAWSNGTVLAADRLAVPGRGRCLGPGSRLPEAACAELVARWTPALEISREILERNLVPLLQANRRPRVASVP